MKTEHRDSMFCIFDYGSEISNNLLGYGHNPRMKDDNGKYRDVVIRQLEVVRMGDAISTFTNATFLCEYTWRYNNDN
jgi:hypothetical protein